MQLRVSNLSRPGEFQAGEEIKSGSIAGSPDDSWSRVSTTNRLVLRHGRLKSLKSRSFVKRFEVLGEFEVEGSAVVATASCRKLCRQFVTRHNLTVLIFGHPLAGFDLLAHQMISMTVFSCQG